MAAQMIGESSTSGPPAADPASGGWLHDNRDWYAVHRGGCNILMADGSVKTFIDQDGDKYLNPGFPVPKGLTDTDYKKIGYVSDTVELHSARCFSGIFLGADASKIIDLE